MKADIAIIGGGAIGVTLALGLAKHTAHSIVLIDAGEPANETDQSTYQQRTFDQRTIALSSASVDILSHMGVSIAPLMRSPIQHIHVSDRGHAGQVRLHAKDHHIDAFGHVVSLTALGQHVYSTLLSVVSKQSQAEQEAQLRYLSNSEVTAVHRKQQSSTLVLKEGTEVNASVVIFADGGRGELAESIGFSRNHKDYNQTALCFVANTSSAHNGWAYERFTAQGPLACLPLNSHQFGVVWTLHNHHVDAMLALSKPAFIAELQNIFGYRQGTILDIGEVEYFPLVLRQVQSVVTQGAVTIGNAAQSLHPIAGQGANLGFRDVYSLVSTFAQSSSVQLSDYSTLLRYQQQRNTDRHATIQLTDGLVHVFSNDFLPLVVGRNIALSALNISAIGKYNFANQAMGNKHAAF